MHEETRQRKEKEGEGKRLGKKNWRKKEVELLQMGRRLRVGGDRKGGREKLQCVVHMY